MGLPVKLSITNSNYSGYDKDLENWETLRGSADLPILKGATISADIGRRQYTDWDDDGFPIFGSCTAFEAKYKQKITDNTRCYVRYRNYDKKNQIRLAAGGSVPLSDELSCYGDIHRTATYSPNEDKPKIKIGGWVGLDYNPKWAKGLNIWVEPVQVNTDGNVTTCAFNMGTSINVQKAYKWFKK